MFTMYLFKFTQRISLYSYKLYSCIYTLYKYSVYYTTLFFNEPHLLLFNPSRSHRSAANSAAQQIGQHSTLSTTPCGSRNTSRLLSFVSAAACEFLVGRCFFVARPSTCETRWKGSDAARPAEAGTKGCGERRLEPTGLREDLSYRRMDVDWDQQNGICFTHPHRHYTHARSWDISIQSRAATEQLSVCLFCF